MASFTARLKELSGAEPLAKSRRIEALVTEIEQAMAEGFSRVQIVGALKDFGIDVTPAQLSTYLFRMKKRQARRAAVPAGPAGSPPSPPLAPPPRAPETAAATAPGFGAHDPRTLDAIMGSAPDMKAFAKLARKGKR